MDDQIGALTGLLRTCAQILRRIAADNADGASGALSASADDIERSADDIDRAGVPLQPRDAREPL